jgi:RNA polymerase sigma-70 factor (ECF subfamily)
MTKDEFTKLALAELDAVDRVALTLARDRADADDLVQETYLRALSAHEQFQLKEYGIRPWLLRILHNTFINRLRRDKLRPKPMESEILEVAAGAAPDAPVPPAPPGMIEDDELRKAMDQLPANMRTIVMLWAVDELSYKELAEVLDIPIGTVMSRIHRARGRLYELMPGHRAGRQSPP